MRRSHIGYAFFVLYIQRESGIIINVRGIPYMIVITEDTTMTNEQRAKVLTTEALYEALKMTNNEEIKNVILNELATR